MAARTTTAAIATTTTTATITKMSLRIRNRQQKIICHCSLCRKKLKFTGTSGEYPFTCWKCMTINVDT